MAQYVTLKKHTQFFVLFNLAFQAHAQFCQSGDNTLEGIRAACRQVASDNKGDDDEDSGEKYVLALSDANLERYGIHPSYARQL